MPVRWILAGVGVTVAGFAVALVALLRALDAQLSRIRF